MQRGLLVFTKLGYRKIAQKGEGIAFLFFCAQIISTAQKLRQIRFFALAAPAAGWGCREPDLATVSYCIIFADVAQYL
ncbi:hypothetical protein ACUZ9P_12415 [Desulfovibrio sp. QI0430]